ncbi:hypothetical protein NL676_022536 [Syzygium grande]|nr:hypothetical protein NL676_022536 [Syzygium grande]
MVSSPSLPSDLRTSDKLSFRLFFRLNRRVLRFVRFLIMPGFVWAWQEGGGNLEADIEQLLNVEKQMRLASDIAGTKKAKIT